MIFSIRCGVISCPCAAPAAREMLSSISVPPRSLTPADKQWRTPSGPSFIQASWVKLGPDGVRHCLSAGVNDLGGTLMDESISRAAGAAHGQETTPQRMGKSITSCGRQPLQRTTLYRHADRSRRDQSFKAPSKRPLQAVRSREDDVLPTICQ